MRAGRYTYRYRHGVEALSMFRVEMLANPSDEECPKARVDELILKDAPDLL